MRALCTPTLPGSQTHAIWALALFVAIQVADGVLTTLGISQYGIAAEGNPLLTFGGQLVGISATIVIAKVFAVCCGTLLHLRAKHLALALLTVGYVAVAIVPWAWMLAV